MMTSVIIEGLVTGIGYALIAIGISITFRVMDVINFAHGELYMLGGFFTFLAMQWLDAPYVVSGLAAVVLTAVSAWLMMLTVGRVIATDRTNTLLATFALSLMISNAVNYFLKGSFKPVDTPFTTPVEFGSIFISGQRSVLIAVGLVLIIAIWLWLRKSLLGKQIRAVAENSEGAQIIGISTPRIYRIVFIGGGALAGLAGVLLSPITQVSAHIGLPAVIKGVVVLVIGGTGNVIGAAIGGVALGVVEAFAATYVSNAFKDVFGYALLILVLLVHPAALVAIWKKKFRSVRKSSNEMAGSEKA